MSRIGSNPETSSDKMEARMLPDISEPQLNQGGELDLMGDGVHKIYLHRGQLDVYNFGAKHTKLRCARGWGKTVYLGVYNLKCVLGLRRMIGLFLGASAKQIYTRTMPNMLKTFNMMGYPEGTFYFLGQAPAKLRWDYPLAKPRVWESCVHMQNGAVIQAASMAVKGSCNGINAAWICGDETKYLPWTRVKEEAYPTLRGDFMPPAARKVEQKRWGYGTDPKVNNYYLSTCFVSDAGLTQAQCEWEKEEQFETKEINAQIAEMLAELRYLEKVNPKAAVQLAQNDQFLARLNALRNQSELFVNASSLDNLAMLGGEEFVRRMRRELPDLMFRIQILGQKRGAAKDGWYSNWDSEIHTYEADELSVDRDTFSLIADQYSVHQKGESLDAQRWPTKWERIGIDLEQASNAADSCICDVDLSYSDPLYISVDCNANINCMVVGQCRTVHGKPSLVVLRTFYTLNERKLISLCREEFTRYYRPYLRRSHDKKVVFLWTPTIKQGGSVAYAVEGAEDFRFDKVIVRELKAQGWDVESVECKVAFHEEKYEIINSCLAGTTSPSIYVNREQNDLLICAIEQARIKPGTYKKDKSREKLHATGPDSLGGDPRTRTDVTDAFDDLVMGVKFYDSYKRKIGGGLRGRFKNLVIPR